MVAQKPRRRQARTTKGNLGIQDESVPKRAGGDNGESSKRLDHPNPRSTHGVKITDNRAKTQGSRFNVSADEMEVETKDKAGEGANNGEEARDPKQGFEGEMDTQFEIGNETQGVNIAVSHDGMTDELMGLKNTNINISRQAQATSDGPREKTEEILKDLTNKNVSRPPIVKASPPITKVIGAHQKENIKI